ncbi:hypothetical protein FA15DRAFT_603433, partial [Coprinopsis marcescibilis]
DHFYTTEGDHKSHTSLINEATDSLEGYIPQGTAAFIFPSHEINTIPLYQLDLSLLSSKNQRQRTSKLGVKDHFYTTSISEREELLSLGWQDAGTVGYIFRDARSGGVPFFRLHHVEKEDHLYTVSQSEKDRATRRGYRSEGMVGFVYPGSVY